MTQNRQKLLAEALDQRILVMDGAMGTQIQALGLEEDDYRGDRFQDHPGILKGNSDLLSLTQPDAIRGIHANYLDAGADIDIRNNKREQAINLAELSKESSILEMLNQYKNEKKLFGIF